MNEHSQLIGFRLLALLGPVVAVGVFQLVMSEPSSAGAGIIASDFQPLPVIPDTAQVLVASTHAPFTTPSPFWFEEAELTLPEMPLKAAPVAIQEIRDPDFVLTAVLPSASKSYAVVNGKPRAEGDEIFPDWTLFKIYGKDRYIVVKHTSGRRLKVLMNHN